MAIPSNGFLLRALVTIMAAAMSFPSSSRPKPLDPGSFPPFTTTTTVPALPTARANLTTCRLDLSDELFGGVSLACSGPLDRSRCCPVLASWLFAAHARSALSVPPQPQPSSADDDEDIAPLMPDDSQRCVDALQASLRGRNIRLARPNASCDPVLCFCGIRLHQLTSLRCPAAFNASAGTPLASPLPAVRELERNCRNSSYAGCSRCLRSLQKVKGENISASGMVGDRASRMFGRDCQLMGLTWLLDRNKTVYIPTVSAVLRALLYSAHPLDTDDNHNGGPICSPDQENMPLAVNSLEFEKFGSNAASQTRWTSVSPFAGTALAIILVGLACGGSWL